MRPSRVLVVGLVLNALAYFALPRVLDAWTPPQRPSAAPADHVAKALPACDIIAFRRSTCT